MAANVMSYSHIRITAIYLPRHGNSIVSHPPLPTLLRERQRAVVKHFRILDQNLPRVVFKCKGKGKAIPLQARSGPGGSRKLRFPDFMTTAQGGVKVVSHTHRPHLPPGNSPGTHFC